MSFKTAARNVPIGANLILSISVQLSIVHIEHGC